MASIRRKRPAIKNDRSDTLRPADSPVELPNGWWWRLLDHLSKFDVKPYAEQVAAYTGIGIRSLQNAKRDGKISRTLFAKLTDKAGFEKYEDLLLLLKSGTDRSDALTPVPTSFSLSTQRTNPQWADFRDCNVESPHSWELSCRVQTTSPYFRFGFKLLTRDARIFGDGAIKSLGENLIVHIGRNNWDRPRLNISAKDIFSTSYMSGSHVEDDDRLLFAASDKFEAHIKLRVDRSYSAILFVGGTEVSRHIVPPSICRRVVVAGWGDREEFQIDVAEFCIKEAI